MKRIARTIVVVALASATVASAAQSTFPSSAQEQVPLSQVFPDIETRASRYADSAERQALTGYAANASAGENQTANEREAEQAAGIDQTGATRAASPRGQVEYQSPFPSAGGPIDD